MDHEFSPGFRLSILDALILISGLVGTFVASRYQWWLGFLVGWVIGHFFLFCNVFRISRLPELIWAGVLLLLAFLTILTGMPGWLLSGAASFLVTIILVLREIKKPYYHGVFWLKLNPGLKTWWDTHQLLERQK